MRKPVVWTQPSRLGIRLSPNPPLDKVSLCIARCFLECPQVWKAKGNLPRKMLIEMA